MYGLPVQRAKSVTFPVGAYVVRPAAKRVPVPSARVFHPAKLKPVLDIFPAVAKVTLRVPVAVTESMFGAPDPPFTSNLISEFH